MTISRTTAWAAGTAALCVLLLVLVWFLVLSPQRADAAEARTSTESTRSQNAQLERRISDLRAEFAMLPQRRLELAAVRRALPADPALAGVLSELDTVAADSGTTLDSVVAGTATTVIGPVPVPEPVATSSPPPADGGEVTPAEDAALRLAAPAPEATGGTADATGGTAGAAAPATVLAAIPVTITTSGDFFAAADFVMTVQTGLERALVVDSLEVAAQPDDAGGVVATLTGRVFVLVDPEAVDATTAGPSPAPDSPGTTETTDGGSR